MTVPKAASLNACSGIAVHLLPSAKDKTPSAAPAPLNAYSPIVVTEAGITKEDNPLHPLKAVPPISVISPEMVTDSKFAQPEKVNAGMLVMAAGHSISVIAVPSKTPSPNVSRLLSSTNVTVARLSLASAASPIVVTLAGMVIEVRPVLAKAPVPISFRPSGSSIEVMPVPQKAYSPITSRTSGRVTEAIAVQLLKALYPISVTPGMVIDARFSQ